MTRYRHRPPPRGVRGPGRVEGTDDPPVPRTEAEREERRTAAEAPPSRHPARRVRLETVTLASGSGPDSARDDEWDPLRPDPEPPAPKPTTTAPDDGPPGPPGPSRFAMQTVHWAVLAAILVLGLVLRLRDPLSSTVLATEDPYRHMERTWDLVQGQGVQDYPPGLMLMLAILTAFGGEAFEAVARIGPPLIGALLPLTMFLLLRDWLHPAGALAGAGMVAAAPEMVRRTNLLFPTTLDLVLIPILLWLLLRASLGHRRHLMLAGALTLAILVTHPWALVVIVPPALVFWLVSEARKSKMRVAAPAGIVALGLTVFVFIRPSRAFMRVHEKALPRLRELVADPSTITPLPQFVDFVGMLTIPVLLLGAAGTVVALRRRDRFSLLALLVTFLLLPITLVDWFGFWFVPHRAIAYMGLGIVMLAALAVAAAAERLEQSRPRATKPAAVGAVALLAVLMVPSALAMEPWYRLYDEDDHDAWLAVHDEEPTLVITGSWQARVGYRGLTGDAASFDEAFFRYEGARDHTVKQHPGLVVLVDGYTRDEGIPTGFLDGWQHIGTWGDNDAYRPPVPSSEA